MIKLWSLKNSVIFLRFHIEMIQMKSWWELEPIITLLSQLSDIFWVLIMYKVLCGWMKKEERREMRSNNLSCKLSTIILKTQAIHMGLIIEDIYTWLHKGKVCALGKDNGSYSCHRQGDYSTRSQLRKLRKGSSLSGPW